MATADPSSKYGSLIAPSLAGELRRIELRPRRAVDADLIGKYKSAFRGSGLIFSDIREYQPGDDVRHIHWNVTARTGKVYVKDFEEDRQSTILLAIDTSRSTQFGTSKTTSRRMIEFAAIIGLLAKQNNDKSGLCLFDSEIKSFIPAKKSGRNQLQRLLFELSNATQEGCPTNLAQALDFINSHQKKRAIIFLVSDFHAENYDENLRRLAHRHDLICVFCADPAEYAFPAVGLVKIQDAESGLVKTIDSSSKSTQELLKYTHQQRLNYVEDLCRRVGADAIYLSDNPLRSLARLMQQRTAKMR